MNPTATDARVVVDTLRALYDGAARRRYGLVDLDQRTHALQAASRARVAGLGVALVVAALLHDIGHMLHTPGEHPAPNGLDDAHERVGAAWLARHFGARVVEPVRLHVDAKRYLCAVQPGYRAMLSRDSAASLVLQGGPMTVAQVATFERTAHWRAAVLLRRIDEAAKDPGAPCPSFESFVDDIVAALRDRDSALR